MYYSRGFRSELITLLTKLHHGAGPHAAAVQQSDEARTLVRFEVFRLEGKTFHHGL